MYRESAAVRLALCSRCGERVLADQTEFSAEGELVCRRCLRVAASALVRDVKDVQLRPTRAYAPYAVGVIVLTTFFTLSFPPLIFVAIGTALVLAIRGFALKPPKPR